MKKIVLGGVGDLTTNQLTPFSLNSVNQHWVSTKSALWIPRGKHTVLCPIHLHCFTASVMICVWSLSPTRTSSRACLTVSLYLISADVLSPLLFWNVNDEHEQTIPCTLNTCVFKVHASLISYGGWPLLIPATRGRLNPSYCRWVEHSGPAPPLLGFCMWAC